MLFSDLVTPCSFYWMYGPCTLTDWRDLNTVPPELRFHYNDKLICKIPTNLIFVYYQTNTLNSIVCLFLVWYIIQIVILLFSILQN